jgi:hypothetical protein
VPLRCYSRKAIRQYAAENISAGRTGFSGPYAFGYLRAKTGSFVAGFAVLMFRAVAAAILMLLIPATAEAGISRSIRST